MPNISLNLPKTEPINDKATSHREEIVNDLKKTLSKIATTEIFQIYTFDDSFLPLIIIADENDEIESISFENLKHEFEINLILITNGYKNAGEMISKTLQELKNFKSEFTKSELKNINKSALEVENKSYVETTISLSFTYFTTLWNF